MNHPPIVNKAKEYVTTYLQDGANKKMVYHTYAHAEKIAEAARQICLQQQLESNDVLITLVAAWFADTGYYQDYLQHENASAQIAENFLRKEGLGDDVIKEIKNCLLATKMPQSPTTLPQQVLCDALMFYLAASDFGEQNKLIRKELSLLQAKPIDKNSWRKQAILFLEEHHYFTEYGKKNWAKKKKENLQKLKKKDAEASMPVDPISSLLQSDPTSVDAALKAEKKKDDRPERTIETMFRITSDKSQRLSDQADTKSNILISVNTLILAGVISVVVPKLAGEMGKYIYSVIILLTVSLTTIIFAILATRPQIPKGVFSQKDIDEKKVNLLFFGNFFKMSFEEYYNGMFAVMDDRHFLYLSLLRDIYTQGLRLSQKYRMLTLAYNIFMFGLILSILAFIYTALLHTPTAAPIETIDY